MRNVTVKAPKKPIAGTVAVPLSKSAANRLLIIRHLAGDDSEIVLPEATDTQVLKEALKRIGGSGDGNGPTVEINVQDAGTAYRFLVPLLAVTQGNWLLTGTGRMHRRPVKPLVDALISMGADIRYAGEAGFPPLRITGKKLKGGHVFIDNQISSQFVSGLMLVGNQLAQGLQLEFPDSEASYPYIQLTAALMQSYGAEVKLGRNTCQVKAQGYTPARIPVEGDWSAAAFWFALVALAPGSTITLTGLDPRSVQGDRIVAEVFTHLGVESAWNAEELILKHRTEATRFFTFNFSHYPDLAPAVAVTCAGRHISARLTGLRNLRVKESDRLAAITDNLTKLGYRATVEVDDAIVIQPVAHDRTFEEIPLIQTFNDHRITMAFALLAINFTRVTLDEGISVGKSYPEFWSHLRHMGFDMT